MPRSEDLSSKGTELESAKLGSISGRGMTGDEVAGPPGPKVLRLLCFVSAGVICAVTINKTRDMERRTLMQQKMKGMSNNSSEAITTGKAGE